MAAHLAWEVVVGLEVHAQVLSRSKLFSAASAVAGKAGSLAEPNSACALFDAAHPGTLPSLNHHCVAQAVRAALALQSRVHAYSAFERKHYLYPDLPHGFQITQLRYPVASQGMLRFGVPGSPAGRGGGAAQRRPCAARIARIQLETDSGKSLHGVSRSGGALVDFNRAGVALLEIVTQPDLRGADEAGAFLRALQLLLRRAGVCDGNMEEGSMRCDVNVSVRRRARPPEASSGGGPANSEAPARAGEAPSTTLSGRPGALVHYRGGSGDVSAGDAAVDGVCVAPSDAEEARAASLGYWVWEEAPHAGDDAPPLPALGELGLRVELKNLASIRAVEAGVEAEARRQVALLEAGEAVASETRSFDVATGRSAAARSKEGEADYRFMREPDLRPLLLSDAFVRAQVAALPELPDAALRRLVSGRGLGRPEAATLVATEGAVAYFDDALAAVERELVLPTGGGAPPEGSGSSSAALTRHGVAKATCNWIINELLGQLSRLGSASSDRFAVTAAAAVPDGESSGGGGGSSSDAPVRGLTLGTCGLAPAALGELIACVLSGAVSARAAKDVLTELLLDLHRQQQQRQQQPRSARDIIAERGWAQLNDAVAIRALCEAAAADPALAATLQKYRAGHERVLGAFVARAIEASGGVANPVLAAQIMGEVLGPPGAGRDRGAGPKRKS